MNPVEIFNLVTQEMGVDLREFLQCADYRETDQIVDGDVLLYFSRFKLKFEFFTGSDQGPCIGTQMMCELG